MVKDFSTRIWGISEEFNPRLSKTTDRGGRGFFFSHANKNPVLRHKFMRLFHRPALRLAAIATQEPQNNQQSEGSSGPMEAGMAVSMVKKAIHPLGLENGDGAIRKKKKGCGVLFNTAVTKSVQTGMQEQIYCSRGAKLMRIVCFFLSLRGLKRPSRISTFFSDNFSWEKQYLKHLLQKCAHWKKWLLMFVFQITNFFDICFSASQSHKSACECFWKKKKKV